MKKLYAFFAIIGLSISALAADTLPTVKVVAPGDFGAWSSTKLMPEYCKKHGLNVELTIVDYKALPGVALAQARGEFDVIATQMTRTLQSVANGNKVHLFTNLARGGTSLVVRTNSTIGSIADLKGKSVLVGAGAAGESITKILLTRAGLTYSTEPGKADVTLLSYPNAQLEVLFMQGTGDAAALVFPDNNKTLETKYGKIVLNYEDIYRTLVIRDDYPADREKKLAACIAEIYQVLNSPNRTAQQNADITRFGVKMPTNNRKEEYEWELVVSQEYINDVVALLKKENELPANFQVPADFNRTVIFKK